MSAPETGRESYPRQAARTRRFTLGAPRAFLVAPDAARCGFLRSAGGGDPSTRLWVVEPDGRERCVVDPAELGVDDTALPPEERARRERVREAAGGVVAWAADRAVAVAAFALGGRVWTADLIGAGVTQIASGEAAVDPRPDPDGGRIGWVSGGALHVAARDGSGSVRLLHDDDPDVTWALPDFIAAEELGRTRGWWWSPDGSAVAAARVDARPVGTWHLGEPSEPALPPRVLRYPAAGTANAVVGLAVAPVDGSPPVSIDWDHEAWPYLVDVVWPPGSPLALVLLTRDQRRRVVLTADAATGATTRVAEQGDAAWIDVVAGVPRWSRGRLVDTLDVDDARRLTVDGHAVSPPDLQVRHVSAVDDEAALVLASRDDPTAVVAWRVPLDGSAPEPLTPSDAVAGAAGTPSSPVLSVATLEAPRATTTWHGPSGAVPIASNVEEPVLRAAPTFLRLGARELATALLVPSGHDGRTPLPVLLDPYGGPHAQRVVRAQAAFGPAQWFADSGFAVLVVDGRGTPGRGPAWERAVNGDLAGPPLQDQVDALTAAAERHPFLDTSRVAIRGWSFGGFLAAAAVLRRPDVFHAAIAGAPVTDWRLYDTAYSERYLGTQPGGRDAAAYDASSLLGEAAGLQRPLLLIHGLADDNVLAAHTLRLSAALLAAGRPHSVLPLSGVSHMTPQEVVAENLLLLQLDFLRRTLGAEPPGTA